MQFHLEGYRPGDPAVADPVAALPPVAPLRELPADIDVLVVGCGPTGLTLAAQLSRFPEISTCIVDQKDGPLEVGQADGIAVRTVEMFQAFGFAEKVVKEAYWVNETVFWRPDPDDPGRIRRSGRIQDVEDGLSEFPHVILNQARVHDFYLEVMRNSPTGLVPDYRRRLVELALPEGDEPAVATFERTDTGAIETIRARYVVGCDGARSTVRRQMGNELVGDAANQAWGVMDVLAVSDFPDIRFKAAVRSGREGNLLIIPREGGYMVRFYIELDELDPGERVANREITVDRLVDAANRILAPYTLEVREVAWWSVYEIGQRMCGSYDDVGDGGDRVPRVFIAGDACHTHSPKAGQGMNVSMRDAFNLGWKLAAVLGGRADPDLLHTYSAERRAVARELIDFDREFAEMFSAPTRTSEVGEGVDAGEFERYFQQHSRYTAGTETRYGPSMIVGGSDHQHLASGFEIGTRFHSAPVIRLADAKPLHLGHVVVADGRWRLFLFADGMRPDESRSRLAAACRMLEGTTSPLTTTRRPGDEVDSVIDVRAVLQQSHRDVEFGALPDLLRPAKGSLGLVDHEKAFGPDERRGDIFDLRGIDRTVGAAVVVRPDQHVAHVLPLDAITELGRFFRFLLPAVEPPNE